MKKYLAMLVAAMLCACCLGLAACGGSSSSSSASASSASGSASASAASSDASASASAASTSASAAASDEVTPEFKEFADEYVATCNELIAVVNKAKEAGSYDAVKDEWTAVSDKLNEYTTEAQKYAQMYANGEMSKADMAYYDDVLLPAALDSASAGLEMLDLIQ